MLYKQIVGKFGEGLIKNYLIKHGYAIIAMNVKISYLEIDIIARLKELIVFIEVKARVSVNLGSADEAITPAKLNNFKKAIELFIHTKKIVPENTRADFIALDIDKTQKTAKIKHYKDVL